jgi:O-antigen ligase/polysaccharide polymerase Wzy-like membrane protein
MTTSARSIRLGRVDSRPWLWLALAPPMLVTAAVTVFWPTFGLVLAALIVVVALAITAPPYAFLVVVLLFGFEGSIKIRFWLEGTPVSSRGSAVGAFLIDLAFLVAVGAGLRKDGRTSLVRIWRESDRWGRVGALLLGAWLALSVVQIPLSGSLRTGLEGFRLTQIYVLALLAGASLLAGNVKVDWVVRALLGVLTVIAAYAAVRTVVGSAASERSFALSHPVSSVAADTTFRNVGSFSGSTGLVSFLMPAGAFAFLLGILRPRYRLFSWTLFALTMVGLVGTYIRTALLAGAIAIAIALALAYRRRRRALRDHKLVALGAFLLIALSIAGTVVASERSPNLSRRAENIFHPLRDQSVKIRIDTLKRSLTVMRTHPLGTGLGTFSGSDSSYLTIAREQGLPGLGLFLLAIVSLLISVGRAVRRRSGLSRSAGAAAFGGVLATALYWFAWDSIQQPGKVLTWGLLGLAMGAAWGGWAQPSAEHERPGRDRATRPSLPRRKSVAILRRAVVPLVLVILAAVTVGVSTSRAAQFRADRLVRVTLRGTGRLPEGPVRYVRDLLDNARSNAGRGWGTRTFNPAISDSTILSNVWVTRGTRPDTVALFASAATPDRAREVVNETGASLLLLSKGAVGSPYRLKLGRPALSPSLHDGLDRFVTRLPGAFPPRPDLVWAAAASMLVGLLLAASVADATSTRSASRRLV